LWPGRRADGLLVSALGLGQRPLLVDQRGAQPLSRLHVIENAVLDAADLALYALDLMEHRLILLVGLDLHELRLVSGATDLQVLKRSLVLPAPFLRSGELLTRGVEQRGFIGEGRVQLRPAVRNGLEGGVDPLDLAVGCLEVDELG
jgi:hypothetical protein